MRFVDWVRTQPRGVLTRLQRELRVGNTTLHQIKNGRPASGRVARLLSDATGGVVSVEELVCPQPEEPAERALAERAS